MWHCTYTPLYCFIMWCLKKHREYLPEFSWLYLKIYFKFSKCPRGKIRDLLGVEMQDVLWIMNWKASETKRWTSGTVLPFTQRDDKLPSQSRSPDRELNRGSSEWEAGANPSGRYFLVSSKSSCVYPWMHTYRLWSRYNTDIYVYNTYVHNILACTAVTMRQPSDKRIYQTRL
jgi:hypothetical protein